MSFIVTWCCGRYLALTHRCTGNRREKNCT